MRYMVQSLSGLLNCRYELALLALRMSDYERFEDNLFQADMLDLQRRYAIIEERKAVFGEGHRIVGNVPDGTGGDSGSAGGMADRQTTTNAAGQTVRIVSHIDLKDEPNSITQLEGKNGRIDRNYYGSDGMQIIQICNSDHGHPKQHPFGKHGEHAHDYKFDHSGELISRIPRELTDEERKDKI